MRCLVQKGPHTQFTPTLVVVTPRSSDNVKFTSFTPYDFFECHRILPCETLRGTVKGDKLDWQTLKISSKNENIGFRRKPGFFRQNPRYLEKVRKKRCSEKRPMNL